MVMTNVTKTKRYTPRQVWKPGTSGNSSASAGSGSGGDCDGFLIRENDRSSPRCEHDADTTGRTGPEKRRTPSFPERNEVRKQAVCARHAGWQLTEKCDAGVDVIALAVTGDQ